MRRRRAGVGVGFLVASALVAALIATSATASPAPTGTTTDVLPSPEELPARTVAVVSHVPVRSRTITVRELGRAIVQVAAQTGFKSTPAPAQPKYKRLEEKALAELLDGLRIEGQAAEMGISTTDKEVAAELAQIKKDNFKTEKQFRVFLQRSHFTLRDVLYRVELQLLTRRIEERVSRGAWSQKELQEKFVVFVAAYKKRWRSRKVCAPRYAIERCSNG